jgi:hypothetical protein
MILMFSIINASEEVPTQEEIAKLYVATFNRAPDSEGLKWWEKNSKLTLSKIAQSFFDQEETKLTYPEGTSNRDFIYSVYKNLFNREPDINGWNYWEEQLNKGAFSKNSFIMAVINGAKDDENGMDKTTLENKTKVGLSFANAGLDNTDDAKTIMTGVDSLYSTVTSALSSFGIDLYNPVVKSGDSISANELNGYTLVCEYQSGVKVLNVQKTAYIFLDNNKAIIVEDYFDGSRRVAKGSYHPYAQGNGLSFDMSTKYDNGDMYVGGIAGPNDLTEITIGASHTLTNNFVVSIVSNADNSIDENTVSSSHQESAGGEETAGNPNAPMYSEMSKVSYLTIYNGLPYTQLNTIYNSVGKFTNLNRYESSTNLHCVDYGFTDEFVSDTINGVTSASYTKPGSLADMCIELSYTTGNYSIAMY